MIEIDKLHTNGSRLPTTAIHDNDDVHNDIYIDQYSHLSYNKRRTKRKSSHSQRPTDEVLSKHSKHIASFTMNKSIDHRLNTIRPQVKHKSKFHFNSNTNDNYPETSQPHSHPPELECTKQHSSIHFSYRHDNIHFSRFYMIFVVILIYLLDTINCDQGNYRQTNISQPDFG